METKYKLVYFGIRGLAEPIRWMFRMREVDFEDERIDLDLWQEEKHRKFQEDLPSYPVYYHFALNQYQVVYYFTFELNRVCKARWSTSHSVH